MYDSSQHTIESDVTEIFITYWLNEKTSVGGLTAMNLLVDYMDHVPSERFHELEEKSKEMADALKVYLTERCYDKIDKARWVGDQKIYAPSDILINFVSGYQLGISVKTSKIRNDVGFKNPGLGTVEAKLDITLTDGLISNTNTIIQMYNLSANQTDRKRAIRANTTIQMEANRRGDVVLEHIRDQVYTGLQQAYDLKDYLLNQWFDLGDLKTPYLKLIGVGKKSPYNIRVEDPRIDPRVVAINTQPIKLDKQGIHSIRVTAGDVPIFNMRVKFDSQKLASSIKFSADPV